MTPAIPMPLGQQEIAEALIIARLLASNGVPVFIAAPSPTHPAGYDLPSHWQHTTPDPDIVNQWRPGWALCAVGGSSCDFLDTDPRNGGTESREMLAAAHRWPISYGRQATPSGGTHDLIVPLWVGKAKVARGIDLQGGRPDGSSRGFVFISPTVRASKTDGVARPYRWLVKPDLNRLSIAKPFDVSGAPIAELVNRSTRTKTVSPSHRPAEIFCDKTPTAADEAIASMLREITDKAIAGIASGSESWGGDFHERLIRIAYTFGGYVGSDYLSNEAAEQMLRGAITAAGATPTAAEVADITSGLDLGAQEPIWVRRNNPPPVDKARPLDGLSVEPDVTPDHVPGSRRVSLRPFLDGTYSPPQPSVGAPRSDGHYLLYPGRWHVMSGMTTAGKTMFALWQAIGVMLAGGSVAYLHFEEIIPDGTTDRLLTLGGDDLSHDMIEDQFSWLSCETRWPSGEVLAAELDALPHPPSLVICDGINAAVAAHGGDVLRTESISQYRRLFVTPSVATGAAVLSLGHPVKDRSRQEERHSFGSTAWLDEVDGVGFRMEASPTRPISPGQQGSSAVYSTKDRYGQVERKGILHKSREAGWYYLGQFSIDSRDDKAVVGFTLPNKATPEVKPDERRDSLSDDDAKVFVAVRGLIADGHPTTITNIRSRAGIKHTHVPDALSRLVVVHRQLTEIQLGRAKTYDLVENYSDTPQNFDDDHGKDQHDSNPFT